MTTVIPYKLFVYLYRLAFKRYACISIFLVLLISPLIGFCEQEDSYDEVLITLNVQRIGSLEVLAIIHDQTLYLPVKDVFDYLKIKNNSSEDLDSITGFFINPKALYSINHAKKQITFEESIYNLKQGDIVKTSSNLYITAELFGRVFGLECIFNFRSLSVTLNSKIELPAIREMQQELMHRNLSRIKGEKKADTTITRSFPLFKLGMADWSVISAQQFKGVANTRVNLGLGTMLAGGEANAFLNYTSGASFKQTQQYYYWRYVNNNTSALRQVTVGKIFAQSTSTIYAPVTGVQFSNAPTTYRKTFGTYRLSNTTEPGWLVELYVNNVMVNYMKADASGFYSFDVPIVYGNSAIKLRFYGPWGEERTREENITIPFNFLPVNQLEYTVTAGIVRDDDKSKYSRANFNYGVSNRLTIGAGVEYLSSVTTGRIMPFINASARLGSNVLISAERTDGVRSKGVLTYRHPSNLQVELNYSKYDEGQAAIKFNYLEEKKAVISVPFHSKKFNAFSRLTVNQFTLPKAKYTSGEFLLSGIVAGVNANLTTYAAITDAARPLVHNNLSVTARLPAGIRITPQAQYEYSEKKVSILKCELEKSFFKQAFMNVSYEKNFLAHTFSVFLSLRYNFSFAQTAISALASNRITTITQSARGSLMYDSKTSYISANDRSNVGKGGITILPYLDLNCNGQRDENEPRAFGLRMHVNGGRVEVNNRDTTMHVWGLEAYTNYYVELDPNSFDNIAWQIKKTTFNVAIDPNVVKFIEVPVAVVGEVSGKVFINQDKKETPIGRMIVNFYNSKGKLAAKTLSESDGYFTYIGLAPGKYTARIDQQQLDKLNMKAANANVAFTIKVNKEGDVVEGLKLVIAKGNSNK